MIIAGLQESSYMTENKQNYLIKGRAITVGGSTLIK